MAEPRYSMIEPIRDVLSSPIQGEALEVDRRWVRVLSQQVQAAEVELTADLAQIPITFEKILNMKTGDVLPINIPEFITAKVDGVPVVTRHSDEVPVVRCDTTIE